MSCTVYAPGGRPRQLIGEAAGGVEGARDGELPLVLVREVEERLGRGHELLGVGVVCGGVMVLGMEWNGMEWIGLVSVVGMEAVGRSGQVRSGQVSQD